MVYIPDMPIIKYFSEIWGLFGVLSSISRYSKNLYTNLYLIEQKFIDEEIILQNFFYNLFF